MVYTWVSCAVEEMSVNEKKKAKKHGGWGMPCDGLAQLWFLYLSFSSVYFCLYSLKPRVKEATAKGRLIGCLMFRYAAVFFFWLSVPQDWRKYY